MEGERGEEKPVFEQDDVGLFDLFRIVLGRWKFIAVFTGSVTLLTLLVSFLLTPIYRGTAVILPIDRTMPSLIDGSGFSSLISLIGAGSGSNASKIMAILKSNSIKERVIEKHDLMRVLLENEWDEKQNTWEDEEPSIWEAIREMDDIMKIKEDKKTGAIGISTDFKDSNMAADISNWFVEELKTILNEKSFSMASHYRESVERVLEPVKEGLADTEQKMTRFQKEEGMIEPEAQAQVMIKVYAELIKEKSIREAQLEAFKDVLGQKNPEIKRLNAELAIIDEKIKEIEGKEKKSLMIPAGTLPEVGMEFIKKKRDLKISEKAYEELLVQYYLAKFQEAKEDVVFQVIDEAIPPDKPKKPRKLVNSVIAFTLGLFLSVFYVLVSEKEAGRKRKF